MTLIITLIQELKQEAAVTRRFLERVPFEKASYKPHEKSEALGRLAIHVAEIVAWWKSCIQNDSLDFIDFEPKAITTTEALLSYFDSLVKEALQALHGTNEKALEGFWSMTYGEEVLFTLPKKRVLRTFCMNHLIHHRAQLGVYLRLLDIPTPASYGPSADEEDVILIEPYLL
jgi:uncharacterized damage-inducible protein DinB